MNMLDTKRIVDIVIEGIDYSDYPDFCDAYIAEARYQNDDGSTRELTDDEYDELHDNTDFVYEKVWDYIH